MAVGSFPDEEQRLAVESLLVRMQEVERLVSDHAQRLDTAQTNPAKRLWWWLVWGEPLTDWNAERPVWRPWNRRRRRAPGGWFR